MRATVSRDGRILLPASLRREDHVVGGESFRIERIVPGEYRLVREDRLPKRRLVEWLRACPEPGYFVEIPSESTDSL